VQGPDECRVTDVPAFLPRLAGAGGLPHHEEDRHGVRKWMRAE
jgi:hypothetical protein